MSRTPTALAIVLAAAIALPAPAIAAAGENPNACEMVKPEEINLVSANKVEKVQQMRSGNPSECGFIDAKKSSVLTVTVRTVEYAVKDEMFQERDNLEKIYRSKSKPLESVGEGGYWLGANHQLGFRKGKTIVSLRFGATKNQNEVDTSQIARVIEARLPK